ncbi:MAG TPA: translation initiation factor IF-3, partial [Thioalkalivibrio sp.]|nr:translation initiation factor IF-3 [Thioalkalivibrio sp.]
MSAGKETRLNEQITCPNVRLIDKDGENVGVVAVDEALRMAEEAELD